MHLDPIAFGLTSVLLAAIFGSLLIFSWLQNRSLDALGWWGASFLACAGGIGLANLQANPLPVLLLFGNVFLALAFGLQYVGCRVFNQRPERMWLGLVGALAWFLLWPAVKDTFQIRLSVAAGIAACYIGATIWELWRNAPHRLLSQSATVFVLTCGAGYFLLRSILGILPSTGFLTEVFAHRWSSGMALVFLLYVPTLAFLMLSMAKERSEFEYRQAALIDPLTRIPNRRAFFTDAEQLLEKGPTTELTCFLFDLDDFKIVNDTFGHATGDEVLCIFADVLTRLLPQGAFGRLGGDEFSALVDMGESDPAAMGKRICSIFEADIRAKLGDHVIAGVTVGWAQARGARPKDLMALADANLYEIKAAKRSADPFHAEVSVVPSNHLQARRVNRDKR